MATPHETQFQRLSPVVRIFCALMAACGVLGAQHLYVRISRDKLRVRRIESGIEVEIVPPVQFSSARLLVGNFEAAEWALKEGVKKTGRTGWSTPSPLILMHPLEMIEGGLSPVETRVLQELAIGAGAMKAKVWTGAELSDAEVVEVFSTPGRRSR